MTSICHSTYTHWSVHAPLFQTIAMIERYQVRADRAIRKCNFRKRKCAFLNFSARCTEKANTSVSLVRNVSVISQTKSTILFRRRKKRTSIQNASSQWIFRGIYSFVLILERPRFSYIIQNWIIKRSVSPFHVRIIDVKKYLSIGSF